MDLAALAPAIMKFGAFIGATIGAGVTQSVLVPSGSSSLEAYAGGSSLSVSFLGKPVGTIAVLRYAVTYNFIPATS